MELRQLRAFVEVAAYEHFGRAAAALKITQPALTQRIQALERELAAQLLSRDAREVRLTRVGEALLPFATRLVQIEDQALRELTDTLSGRAGRLRIAYLSEGDVVLESQIVAEFRGRHPGVRLETSAGYSQTNIAQVRMGDIDAAFVGLPADIPTGVIVLLAGPSSQLMLALPTDHRLAELERVPVSALRGEPLILSSVLVNPAMNAALRSWLTRHTGHEPNVVAEEPAEHAIQAVASSRSAATFVNNWRSSARVMGVVFKPMAPAPLVESAIVFRSDNPLPVLKNLLEVATEIGRSYPREAPHGGELI